ncbi:hypothetical protein [Acidomonas methanolica]|uniref:hypothetical protein n=1 Tax=Acidomonas methanolica TaxID=437 RepID=UPI002119D2A3|nr:hypothetical protein [Acidomonas methanolica]MCQ9154752.1 hypothetical protein [Acidomonas methanolica]
MTDRDQSSGAPQRPSFVLKRRGFLSAAATGWLGATVPAHALEALNAALSEETEAEPAPEVTLLLGGMADTLIGQSAPLLAGNLAAGLGLSAPPRLRRDVGRDGVTSANNFDIAMDASGRTALLVPGAAIIATLAGDPRVHFDYSRWVPLLIARQPVLTLARADLHQNIETRFSALIRDRAIRLAVSQPTGVELASLLGLTLLGLRPIPVPGLASMDDALNALAKGTVDAVQLVPDGRGGSIAEMVSHVPPGVVPLFHMGPFPAGLEPNSVPSFEQSYAALRRRKPTGPLYDAWQAVSAAAATGFLLVLPMLSSPAQVARWRHAAGLAAGDANMRRWSDAEHLSLVAGAASAPLLGDLTPDLTALLALRRWVAINTPRWRAGQESKPG